MTASPVRRLAAPLGLVLLAAATLTGCGEDGADDATLQVLAAASLTDVFADLADDFEEDHDGVEVELSFGSSTDLAEQAADGAPGDVLATADEASMTIATDAGAAAAPTTFATNVLVIVTPPDNPAGIESLADLDGATWVRCADEAPCGKVAAAVLADNDVTAEPASLEEDVRATLDKVTSGEADAGLVYATDAVAAGDDVTTIAIDGAEEQLTSYSVAALDQSSDAELADEWVDLVTGPDGQAVLTEAGFTLP
ncbi:molybdate ABC transporter substrate-binding protein [Nocardioides sambongensis]|uniref:molybdate ABC transporter substrate-binding protein n=1 Tax=Nocardioides sambongensis TaxID=2589074 RepID=UPI001127BE4E|nr:molybdate ABC transporter substrate-binding protein [Nocardioides sambongensis]